MSIQIPFEQFIPAVSIFITIAYCIGRLQNTSHYRQENQLLRQLLLEAEYRSASERDGSGYVFFLIAVVWVFVLMLMVVINYFSL